MAGPRVIGVARVAGDEFGDARAWLSWNGDAASTALAGLGWVAEGNGVPNDDGSVPPAAYYAVTAGGDPHYGEPQRYGPDVEVDAGRASDGRSSTTTGVTPWRTSASATAWPATPNPTTSGRSGTAKVTARTPAAWS